MSFCISQPCEQKSSHVCRNEQRLPMLCKNGRVEETRNSERGEQNVSDKPSQQTVGPVIEEIPSWCELPSAQLAGKTLIESHLEQDPGTISKCDFEIGPWSV